jgi:hypothetical protein
MAEDRFNKIAYSQKNIQKEYSELRASAQRVVQALLGDVKVEVKDVRRMAAIVYPEKPVGGEFHKCRKFLQFSEAPQKVQIQMRC